MDDIVILASNKEVLHKCRIRLQQLLRKYDLKLKDNYQVFLIEKRGISFVGFVFYHDYIKLRKNIYKKIIKLCYKYKNNKITKAQFKRSMAAYYGWIKCCKSKGICKTIYRLTGIYYSNWKGKRTKITTLYNKNIKLYHIDKRSKYFLLQAIYKSRPIEVYTENKRLCKNLLKLKRNCCSLNIMLKYWLVN